MMKEDYLADLIMQCLRPEVQTICVYGTEPEPVEPEIVIREKTKVVKQHIPEIVNVVFNDPATIVFWSDGTKTVVKCQKDKGDVYSKETGLAIAITKKAFGNNSSFNEVFDRWLGE